MDTERRLVNTTSLKTARLTKYIEHGQLPFMRYDDMSDHLILTFVPNTVETTVHYIDDHVALLYEPKSMEVIGFQVEAFLHSFMAKHSSLNNAWRLSDTGFELEDVADLSFVFEQKKRIVARELKTIADDIMSGWSTRRNQLVPA